MSNPNINRKRLSMTSDLISKIHEEAVFKNILKVVRDKQENQEPRLIWIEILDVVLIFLVSVTFDLMTPMNFFDFKLVLTYTAYKNVGLSVLFFSMFFRFRKKLSLSRMVRYLIMGMPALSMVQSSYFFQWATRSDKISESFHSFTTVNNCVQFNLLVILFLLTRKCLMKEIKALIIAGSLKEIVYLLTVFYLNHSFSLSRLLLSLALNSSVLTLIYLRYLEKNRLHEEDRKEASAVEKKALEFDEKVKKTKEEIEKRQANNQVHSFTSSKADDLLMKLKFLKLSLLMEENKKERGVEEPIPQMNPTTSQSHESLITNSSRNTSFSRRKGPSTLTTIINNPITPISELAEMSPTTLKSHSSSNGKLPLMTPQIKGKSSHFLFYETKKPSQAPEPTPLKEEYDKWKLNAKDVDKILDSILNQGKNIWMPEFLNQKKESKYLSRGSSIYTITSEAKDFLMNHYAEKDESINKIAADQTFISSPTFTRSPTASFTCIDNLGSWNFDVFDLNESSSGNALIEFGNAIFHRNNINRTLGIDSATYFNFLNQLQTGYNKKPYHNAMHAVDVTNSVIFFLENGLSAIPELEESCLLISSLAHDLGHPGLNNSYLVSSRSKEALIYNDQCVLENFHVASTFQIISKDQNNILKHLTLEQWVAFRKLCIFLILETDLQKHFLIVNKFKNMLTLGSINMQEDSTSRHIVLSVALKCGDIGHGSKGLALHKRWSRRILEEFYSQGDQETKIGLSVSPLCDRSNNNICKSQEGFLKALVLPLFETWNEFLKKFENVKDCCIEQITSNIQFWKEELKNEESGAGTFLKETEGVLEEMKREEENEQLVYQSKQEYMSRFIKKSAKPLIKLNSLKI